MDLSRLATPYTWSSDAYADEYTHPDQDPDADQNPNPYVYAYSDQNSDAYSD